MARCDFGLKLTSKMLPGPGRGLPIKKLTQQVAKPSRAGLGSHISDTATMRAISPRIKTLETSLSTLKLRTRWKIQITHNIFLPLPQLEFQQHSSCTGNIQVHSRQQPCLEKDPRLQLFTTSILGI